MSEEISFTYLMNGRYVSLSLSVSLRSSVFGTHAYKTHTTIIQGSNHADPRGVHTRVLCRLFQQLLQKSLGDTEMDANHRIVYGDDRFTSSERWWTILRDAHIWFDWFSVPQLDEDERRNTLASIPAYVERSDFMLILAPCTNHADRINIDTGRKCNLCYRM